MLGPKSSLDLLIYTLILIPHPRGRGFGPHETMFFWKMVPHDAAKTCPHTHTCAHTRTHTHMHRCSDITAGTQEVEKHSD